LPRDPDDAKLVTLARAARARLRVPEAAAVRDDTGRTYVAGTVELPTLRLSALEAAVAAAVSSGAERLEAAALVTDGEPAGEATLADLRTPLLLVAGPDGTVRDERRPFAG
jgi:hypothetical protein